MSGNLGNIGQNIYEASKLAAELSRLVALVEKQLDEAKGLAEGMDEKAAQVRALETKKIHLDTDIVQLEKQRTTIATEIAALRARIGG